jgi:hypothetical protein
MVLLVSSLVLTGTAMAHKSPVKVKPAAEEAPAGECSVRTLPSFVDQGEFGEAGSIADVVQVSCGPVYAGQMVKISSEELYNRCGGHLTWSAPYPYSPVSGSSFTVQLDDAGNATAVLWAGPSCASGESLISVHLVEAPYTTSTTSFMVLPPASSPPGVTASPAGEIEDATYGSVGTIVQVEFPSVDAERRVDINAEQLYARCLVAPHLTWVGADAKVLGEGETVEVKLDNDGNAFVVLLGGASCASGDSEIEASLVEAPYTTYTTNFTIIPPQPMEKPAFSIEKLQEIPGSGSGYSAGPLTGKLGQTVDYEIVVRNTGPVAETFAEFHDARCDPGTITGGPGSSQVAPGEATTYTCSHVLTSVGNYVNEATVTGSSADGTRVTHTSNQVVVDVPAEPAFTIEKLQEISGVGAAFTSSPLTGKLGQTVDYEIIVTNSGNEALTFSGFTDAHCDAGTIAGGPGEAPLQPGASATYTCSHVLSSVGSYVNEATATGTPPGEAPIIHTSHPVEVNVPPGGAYFMIQKLQEIAGSTGGFTTSSVTGTLGQTVDYEIIVTNAGDVALTFSGLTDAHCDAGTIAGGPGETPLQPGASTMYTCSHVLNSVGSYVNEATVTGTPPGEAPITQTSNAVAALVPAQAPAPSTATSSPSPTPSTATSSPSPTPASGVAAVCELSEPATVLRGASGPKRATFAVQIRSAGIKQITFYLDGRKLKILKGSQAKGGKFTIEINPAKLSYGAHKVSAKTIMIDSKCKPLARSSVFVRPHSARVTPKFTG